MARYLLEDEGGEKAGNGLWVRFLQSFEHWIRETAHALRGCSDQIHRSSDFGADLRRSGGVGLGAAYTDRR
jgi:hypothetical protein